MDKLLKKRVDTGHKGNYGRVAIIGGSFGMHGSIVLSSKAAIKSGCGYTYAIVPMDIFATISNYLCESIIISIEYNNILLKLDNVDAIAIGMGMGQATLRSKLLFKIIKEINKQIVIDADGINMLKDNLDYLKDKNNIVITPHPGEMANLLNVSISEIQNNRIYYSELVANKYNITVVLKGHQTIVASKNKKTYINDTGNPGMATAGSGDALSGVIASLLAQGLTPFQASALGVYLHGYAGDLAASDIGEYGMIASDIIFKIPQAIKDYISNDIDLKL